MFSLYLLPIDGGESLKYGSNDAGLHFHADLPELNGIMDEITKLIKLAPHEIKGHTVRSPGDLEVHLGRDGQYYVLYAITCYFLLTP